MKGSAIVFALIMLSASVMASYKLTQKDPRTNFPCSGLQSSSQDFFFFGTAPATTIKSTQSSFTYNNEMYTATFEFAVCHQVAKGTNCPSQGVDNAIGYAYLVKQSDPQVTMCVPLSNPNSPLIDWNLNRLQDNEASWSVMPQDNTVHSSVTIKPYFMMTCNSDNSTPSLVRIDRAGEGVNIYIQSAQFCAVNSGKLIYFFENFKFLPIILIPIALFLIFFGIRFIKIVLFKMGFLLGTLTAAFIFISFKDPASLKSSQLVVAGVIVILVGILVGWVFTKLTKLCMMIAGGFFGYVISFKVFELINIMTGYSSDGLQVGVCLVCLLIGIIVGYKIHDHVLILSTSFGGSFLLCFSVGTLIGNYPDLDNIKNFNKLDDKTQKRNLAWLFLAYTAAWLLISILGAWFQYKRRAELIEKKKEGKLPNNSGDYINYDYYGYNDHPAKNQYI